jgi:hypothetical protein
VFGLGAESVLCGKKEVEGRKVVNGWGGTGKYL